MIISRNHTEIFLGRNQKKKFLGIILIKFKRNQKRNFRKRKVIQKQPGTFLGGREENSGK